MRTSRYALHLGAIAAYFAVALGFNWPLPAQLGTRLTGAVSGDTGVYVWNIWVFHHELIEHGRLPFTTNEVFSLTTRADLSLHNYTTFANVLAFPLVSRLGVVATFNIVYLTLLVLTAYATFLLARRVTQATPESWLAGALFAFSPMMMARSTAYFSLIAAAPLPIFVLLLMRISRHGRLRDAALAGLTVAWAAFCDVYYAVYCLLLAGAFVASRILTVTTRQAAPSVPVARALDTLLMAIGGLIVALALRGGGRFQLLGLRISMYTLYTPVLVFTAVALVRLFLAVRPRITIGAVVPWRAALRLAAVGAVAMLLPLSPMVYAIGQRVVDGRLARVPVFWRSSAPGLDLLSFLMPNPMHPLFGAPWRAWLSSRPGHFVENVASLTFVAMIVIAVAAWRRPGCLPRRWLWLTAATGLAALGPFVHVAGINTYLPTPWTLLRYAPLVGSARMPGRLATVMLLGWAILFAIALREATRKRRWLMAPVAALLLFELCPAPRSLFAAEASPIYQRIAADRRDDVRVLELPTGLRDGLSSTGNFNAEALYHQTIHRKRLVGGYLSRVSGKRVRLHRRMPVMEAILILSEGRPLSPAHRRRAWANRDRFLRRANLGYVVVNRTRASDELRAFAIEVFDLVKIQESDSRELFLVGAVPEDAPRISGPPDARSGDAVPSGPEAGPSRPPPQRR